MHVDDGGEICCTPAAPCVSELIEEFQRCGPEAGPWNRSADAERVRFALWDNQSPDGKKHSDGDYEAKPWEHASDLRVFLVDDIINEEVAVAVVSFWRAIIRAQGTNPDDAGSAAVVTSLLNWLIHSGMSKALKRELELSAQYQKTYGWVALHVTWNRELGKRMLSVSLDQLEGLQAGATEALLDPTRTEEAMAILSEAYNAIVAQECGEAGIEDLPPVRPARIRRAIRDLRSDGVAEIPIPIVAKSEPSVTALRPWHDIFIPEEIGDVQRGNSYVRQFFREDELRAKVLTDGWDEEWVEEAIKTKGYSSVWSSDIVGLDQNIAGSTWATQLTQSSAWIEVVTAYSKRCDEDGFPGIYVTVFSPHFSKSPESPTKELVATHGLIDYEHGEVPLVVGVREWVARSITASRGIPEVAASDQRLSKVMQDSLVDRTSLTTLPPRLVPARLMDSDQEFGPAAKFPVLRGEEPKFMSVPGHDGVAESILRYTNENADQRFGRLHPNVSPTRVMAKQQHAVSGFLGMWADVFRQVVALVMQYMPPREFERITGFAKPQLSPEEIRRSYDMMMNVDVREMDVDYAMKQLQAISQFVLPEDAAGVIDRAKLVKAKLQAINPMLARDLVSDQAGAQQKLFKDVAADIASMFLGNPPALVENDPTAPMQLQFAAQIIQANPNYQQALQQGGRFAEMLQVWGKNRMQSQVQEQNKVVGRLGVQPVEPGQ